MRGEASFTRSRRNDRRLFVVHARGGDRTRAQKEAEVAVLRSQAELAAATNKAKGMVAEAEAEMKAVESLAEKRKFELEWKRLEVHALVSLPVNVTGMTNFLC